MKRTLLPALVLVLTQCQKADPAPVTPPDPLSQLPAATQTGQRTFGCLVNGKAWTPAGNPFGGPLFTVSYLNSRLGISANRVIVVNGSNSFQRIGFSISNMPTIGTYLLNDSSKVGSYENFDNSCAMYTSASQVGTVVITKLDVVNRIVSGTFAFTLATPGCGQAVVTSGRFDSLY